VQIEAAVVREEGGPFTIETVDLESPQPDELVVDIVGTGVCHADIIARDQEFPTTLPAVFGHEGAGIVRKVGPQVTAVEPGDSVVLTFDYDGVRRNCRHGEVAYCDEFFARNFEAGRPSDGSSPLSKNQEEIDGTFFRQSSFATHSIVSERNVVAVPDDAPLELLGPLGCGVQTGAGGVINSLAPNPGSSLVIFGAGSVGLSALLAANLVGCSDIVLVDLDQGRLEKASELGATDIINPVEVDDVVDAIKSALNRGADYTLETTGQPSVLKQATDVLAPKGECGVIGAPPMGTEVGLDVNHILNGGRSVQGIVEGDSVPKEFIPDLLDLYQQGEFPFDELISFYDFEEINQAVADVEAGEVIKPVLLMNPSG
jgi:aryl-alcohol dehydrogenase